MLELLSKDDILLLKQQNIIKNNKLSSKYVIGKIEIGYKTSVLVYEDKKFIIDNNDLNGAYNNDIVLAQKILVPYKSDAKVIKIFNREDIKILAIVENKKLYSLKAKAIINIKHNFKDKDIVWVNLKTKDIELFGNIDDANIDELLSLYLYEQDYRLDKYDFNYNYKEINTKNYPNYIDLTNLDFITIDPDNAKDFDDAICYIPKENKLFIAIADVTSYVDENLEKEAFKRAFTIYFPNKSYPMIPHKLSDDLCSLKPNENRLAFVYEIDITKQGEVKNYKRYEAIIKSKKRFTYSEVDNILQKKDKIFNIVALYNLTKNLKQKRLKKGFDFKTSEYKLVLENNLLKKVEKEISTPSHSLIEECMLLANILSAKELKKGIFRVHEVPSQRSLENLIDELMLIGIEVSYTDNTYKLIKKIQKKAKKYNLEEEVNELIIKSLKMAYYSPKNIGHFGLGFDSYSHFTSPIRRYSDLVLHKLLKNKKVNEIDKICDYISKIQLDISYVEEDFKARKYARWASVNLNKILKAKIIDIKEPKAIVIDKMEGLVINILNYSQKPLFSIVDIKITDVNIAYKEVYGEIIN